MDSEGQIGLTRQEVSQMEKQNTMSECMRISRTLQSVGFSREGIEFNEDGFKLKGKLKHGETTVCVMDLALNMPQRINRGDPREIIAHLQEIQNLHRERATVTLADYIIMFKNVLPEKVINDLTMTLDEIG